MLSIPICRRGVLRTDKSDANQCRSVGHDLYVWFVKTYVYAGYSLKDSGFKDQYGQHKLILVPKSIRSPLNSFGQTIDHNEIEKAIMALSFTNLGSCELLATKIIRNIIAHAATLNTYFSRIEVSTVAITNEVLNKGIQEHSGNIPSYAWFTNYALANIEGYALYPSMDETTYKEGTQEANRLLLPETYLPILDEIIKSYKPPKKQGQDTAFLDLETGGFDNIIDVHN